MTATNYLTVEMLDKTYEDIRTKQLVAHGTAQNPHIVHPRGGVCLCGRVFVMGDDGRLRADHDPWRGYVAHPLT